MRKKFLRTFIASAVIASFLVVPAYAETAVITGNRVNVRSGPGTGYYVIATLDRNTPVTVTDRSNGSWYAVSVGGQSGFVAASYLSLDESSAATAPVFTPAPSSSGSSEGYINAMYVRFRSGPGSEYSVLGEYNRGKAVTPIGSGDGWTACIIDGQLGYVYTQYVTLGTSSADTSVSFPDFTPDAVAATTLPQPNEAAQTTSTPTPAPTATATPTPTAAPIPSPEQTAAAVPTPTPTPTATPAPTESASAQTAAGSGASGYINGTYVRFRSGPGTNHSILGTYHTGKALTVTADAGNGWYQCVIDGVTGYVYSTYVLIVDNASSGGLTVGGQEDTVQNPQSSGTAEAQSTPAPTETPAQTSAQYTAGYITGNNVRFRSAPSMTASILGEFFYGNPVSIITSHDGWAQVVAENGQGGYVSSMYVKEGSYSVGSDTAASSDSDSGSASSSASASNGSVTGQQIASYACQFVGSRYVWGGTTPDGFDCSGLVYYVYKQFGYTLNRVAADQASNGRHVEPSELQPGDILCFYSGSSYIGHAGIYIGNGQFVHASNSTTGVIISDLAGYYVSRGYEARRIIG